jgi:hypothetical protein
MGVAFRSVQYVSALYPLDGQIEEGVLIYTFRTTDARTDESLQLRSICPSIHSSFIDHFIDPSNTIHGGWGPHTVLKTVYYASRADLAVPGITSQA